MKELNPALLRSGTGAQECDATKVQSGTQSWQPNYQHAVDWIRTAPIP